MSAHAEGVLLPQALLRRRAQTVRQEVLVAVPEDDVRDDLLVAGIVLHLGSSHEKVVLADHRLVLLEPVAHESVPRAIGEYVFPFHAQHLLRGRAHS